MAFRLSKSRGFTLVELLVVIAIIGVLVALLLPAVQQAREAARRMQCSNHQKQIALATHNFHDVQGRFPPQFGWIGEPTNGAFGTILFHLLPFIEQGALYETSVTPADITRDYPCSYDQTAGTHDSRWNLNNALAVATYICPSDTSQDSVRPNFGWGGSSYATNFQVFGNKTGWDIDLGYVTTCDAQISHWQGKNRIADILDGTSNTILSAEKFGTCGSDAGGPHRGGNMWVRWDWLDPWQPTFAAWTKGPSSMFQNRPLPFNSTGPCIAQVAQTPHPGVMVVSLADGSVRNLSGTMNSEVWWAMCTAMGGETLSAP